MSELARQHACRRPAVALHRVQLRCPARRRRSVTSESEQKTLKFLFGHPQLRADRAPRQPLFPQLLQTPMPNPCSFSSKPFSPRRPIPPVALNILPFPHPPHLLHTLPPPHPRPPPAPLPPP